MKLFNVSDLALNNKGEYVLGLADIHTHACYFIYGVLKKGERDRVIKPGKGHEEIVCLVSGEVMLRNDRENLKLKEGLAFHITGETSYFMDNTGDAEAVYVVAGGHGEGHHH